MKKFLVSTIIFSIILFSFLSVSSLAANMGNNIKNATNSIGQAIGDTSNNAKNAIQNGENKVEEGLTAAKNTIMNSSENVTKDAENAGNDVIGSIDNHDSNYDATRTATDSTTLLGMSTTGWTWLILAIVGVVIVGLVWYYGSQYEHTNYDGE